MFNVRSGFRVGGSSQDSDSCQSAFPLRFRLPPLQRCHDGVLFASISSAVLHNLGRPSEVAGHRKEATTGYDFPLEICSRTTRDCPALTGLGVRAKRLFGLKNLNIYALGIYVDTTAAKHVLSKYKGQQPEELVSNQNFYDDLLQSKGVDKTLRLVISFSHVSRKQFVSALEERLAPSVKKAGDDKSLDLFHKQFDAVDFKKGLDITFIESSGRLTTKVDGKQVGVINSPTFSRSLFEIYLGKDAVSAEAKQTFGKNLAITLKE